MNLPLNKLSHILKILHVSNHFENAMELLNGSNMLRYQHMYPNMPLIGGAKKTNKIIEYKGAKFIFYYYGDKYSMQYTLHPQEDEATQCLIIIVDVINSHVVIHGTLNLLYLVICFSKSI